MTQIHKAKTGAAARRVMRKIGTAIAVGIISLAIGFVLVEAGYRLLLLRTDARLMLPWRLVNPANLPPIEVYNRSLWIFDPDEGYQYVREDVDWTRIERGIVSDCARLNPIKLLEEAGSSKATTPQPI